MCEHTRSDKTRNEIISKKDGSGLYAYKMRKARRDGLSMCEGGVDTKVRRCERLVLGDTQRGRSRSKKYLVEVIR